MARPTTTFKITGLEELRANLRNIPKQFAAEIVGEMVEAVAKPVTVAAKRFASSARRTGALEASIKYVVRKYPEDGAAVAVVGIDKNYYYAGQKLDKHKRNFALATGRGLDRPINYAHLIEFGHMAVQPKAGTSIRKKTAKTVGFVPARPFMRPAFALYAGAARDLMANAAQNGLARIVANTRGQAA